MNSLESYYLTEEHELFRKSLREFLDKEVVPFVDQWEEDARLPKELFKKFGDMGYFGMTQEEKYGGSNLDFWYDVIFIEEVSKSNSGGFGASISAHPYLSLSHLKHEASDFLKEKYLPKAIAGELVGALAITEPHAGSDVAGIKTTAVRQGDKYIINGSKCFITNGVFCDYMIVACKTASTGSSGISMILVEGNSKGLSRNNLKKLGWKASDTAEIAFDNVEVPVENLLGEENKGFYYIMQRFELERLTLALGAIASSEWALEYTLQYMNERKAFGKTINKFQVLRHKMAQLSAEIESVKTFTYHVCKMHADKNYCVKEASMSKYLATELSDKVAYQCLQMFGGYGYMEEYKMARFFRDSRLGTIGGGSSEIMCEIIAKMVIDDVNYQAQESRARNQDISIEELFTTLPSRLKKEKANGIELNVLFEFENNIFYLIEIMNQEVILSTVDRQMSTVDLTITTTTETYIGVETGKLNPQEVFMSGKIQVSDLGKMMQFGGLFKKYTN
ncbi:MAG: acyl-CoA dehydrogenase family protein [Sphingobacteriales bacterium]|nr:acyl-CoA dehydrogenase family protein [Sphingobacteriales bacterium]MBP8192190.1 acyl-CoA dehydrogenase family protein [Chitinophagales bacterium]